MDAANDALPENVRQINPRMSFRLPREDDYDYHYDEKPTVLDTAFAILGPRLKENRQGFVLDGKPANLDKVLKAANLKCKDEAA